MLHLPYGADSCTFPVVAIYKVDTESKGDQERVRSVVKPGRVSHGSFWSQGEFILISSSGHTVVKKMFPWHLIGCRILHEKIGFVLTLNTQPYTHITTTTHL